jgi:hypothetical protein
MVSHGELMDGGAETGLDDFGDDSFREGLRSSSALGDEARLNAAGELPVPADHRVPRSAARWRTGTGATRDR